MQGVKTIRTSNWDQMARFYGETLAMKELEGADRDMCRQYHDYGTEVWIERVNAESEHELLGSLELYSEDSQGLARFMKEQRDLDFETRIVSEMTELLFHDPDGHVVVIKQREKS